MRTHKKFTSGKEKRENERLIKKPDSSPLLLVVYLLGITGLLIALNDIMMLDTPRLYLTIIAACVFSSLMWYIYIRKTRYFGTFVILFCMIAVIFCLSQSRSIRNTYLAIVHTGIAQISVPVIILLSATLLLLTFTLEFVSRNHSIMFLLCTAVLVFGPLIGINLKPVTAVMIFIFQFAFVVLNPSGNSPKKILHSERGAHTAAISTITAAALLLASFIPAFLAENKYHYDILSRIYLSDGYIQDIIAKLSDNFDSGISDGMISRGNLHQTGDKMFTAELVNPPQQTLYLKSFTGYSYNGNYWDSAYWVVYDEPDLTGSQIDLSVKDENDEDQDYYDTEEGIGYYREPFVNELIRNEKKEYFENVAKTVKDSTTWVVKTAMYSPEDDTIICVSEKDQHFTVHRDGRIVCGPLEFKCAEIPEYPERLLSAPPASDPINEIYTWDVSGDITTSGKGNTINITPEPNKNVGMMSPYYARHTYSSENDYSESVNYSHYDYYKYQSSMVDSYSDGSAKKELSPYRSFIEKYYDQCLKEYTYVPYQNMPRLTKLCGETNLTDVNEISTFILYTLQNNATYSTTPGSVPFNKDTIEYFLFENHKGYCVHFATTAVLMYRLFGIPARYASGYVVNDSLFSQSGSGTGEIKNAADYRYTADVTDHTAHAWAEIFLKDYGWVPVEVTPTTEGIMSASYPGYDTTEMYRIMQKYNWEFTRSSSAQTVARAAAAGGGGNNADTDTVIMIILCAAAAAAILFFPVRRVIIIKKEKNMSCARLYDRLIRCLHSCRRLNEYNGSENDFAKALADSLSSVTQEDADQLVGILQQMHYSADPITENDRKQVYTICRSAMDELYESSPWYRKIHLRFIKAFK